MVLWNVDANQHFYFVAVAVEIKTFFGLAGYVCVYHIVCMAFNERNSVRSYGEVRYETWTRSSSHNKPIHPHEIALLRVHFLDASIHNSCLLCSPFVLHKSQIHHIYFVFVSIEYLIRQIKYYQIIGKNAWDVKVVAHWKFPSKFQSYEKTERKIYKIWPYTMSMSASQCQNILG